MPTIHDVARQAGVSIATVSRALRAGAPVAPDTRDRVLRAVQRLGYSPHAAGIHLRTTRSHRLLVTVPDIASPFFSLVLHGIEDATRRRGYALLLGDVRDERAGGEHYSAMLGRREAEGWILLGHALPAAAAPLRNAAGPALPIVSVCQFHEDSEVASVHIDNARAAVDALDHLWSLGHRRIGLVSGPHDNLCSVDRVAGARGRARELGASLRIAAGDFSPGSGKQAALALLSSADRPTALFCLNDEMAFGAMEAARRLNLRVPHDLSVIGFDDIRFAAETEPALTTVAQPGNEIGAACVDLVLEILAGRASARAHRVLSHRLVVRNTTAPPSLASTGSGPGPHTRYILPRR